MSEEGGIAPSICISVCAWILDAMTKVISLSDEAYRALKRLKREGESFSDVVLRLIRGSETRPLTDFSGRWVGDDIEEVFKRVLDERERAEARGVWS